MSHKDLIFTGESNFFKNKLKFNKKNSKYLNLSGNFPWDKIKLKLLLNPPKLHLL